MPATSFAPAHFGFHSQVVAVECDLTSGLPAMIVVGLADKAVDEARERIRSAIRNSGLIMLPKRYTLNLAPADLPKDGTIYDLAMAMSILAASGQIKSPLTNSLFLGELALDGSLRPVRGVIAAGQLAAESGITDVFLPAENAAEATMIDGIIVHAVSSLLQVFRHFTDEQRIKPYKLIPTTPKISPPSVNFADIIGQSSAKRALEIAASGGHHVLLSGSPGAGKTLLAKATAGILPPTLRDELPEFGNSVLEVLRQPLESGQITVSRAQGSVIYPARFMLIAAQNPCPCGYYGDPTRDCSCSPGRVASYRHRVSGPLLDRFDILINVAPLPGSELLADIQAEATSLIASRVQAARQLQNARATPAMTSAEMNPLDIRRFCRLDTEGSKLAQQAIVSLKLSARSYQRSLKVSRTIADLDGSEAIQAIHLAEAFQYRSSL